MEPHKILGGRKLLWEWFQDGIFYHDGAQSSVSIVPTHIDPLRIA